MTSFTYKFEDLLNPVLTAMHMLGGSASSSEIEDTVTNILALSEEKISEVYRGNITKLSYTLALSRNYLKKYGIIDTSKRGVWVLTQNGLNTFEINTTDIILSVRKLFDEEGKNDEIISQEIEAEFLNTSNAEIKELKWQEQLLEGLKIISPDKFERLCQRLLRELGFINVEVTGKVGDGGIDGKGVLKMGNILSFYIVFQCKRYQGTISPDHIRAFRGALEGRADKGLFITTGTFSREAKKEANREGAKPIDIVDGFELAELLKFSNLGVTTELVERVTINEEWFKNF